VKTFCLFVGHDVTVSTTVEESTKSLLYRVTITNSGTLNTLLMIAACAREWKA